MLKYDKKIVNGIERVPNFTPDFMKFVEALDFVLTPEEVMAYIYAVLHSPIYRKKYLEFLKVDFPSIPFTKNKDIFFKYAKLGQQLIDLHLMKYIPDDKKIKVEYNSNLTFPFVIDKIIYEDDTFYLHTTTKEQIKITGISKEIHDFEIGSYKPIEKWLKYRKKDCVPLEIEDLQHIKNVAIVIKNTIIIMSDIEILGEDYLIEIE
jgi:predicted helicase